MNLAQSMRDVTRAEIYHEDYGLFLRTHKVKTIDVQDGGKTVKIFLSERSKIEPLYNTAQFSPAEIERLIGLLKKEYKTPDFKEVFGIDKLRLLYHTWKTDGLTPDFKELSLAVLRSTNMRPEYADGICRHFHDENGQVEFDELFAKIEEYRELKKREGHLLNTYAFPKMSRTKLFT